MVSFINKPPENNDPCYPYVFGGAYMDFKRARQKSSAKEIHKKKDWRGLFYKRAPEKQHSFAADMYSIEHTCA
jgi:hypothetical protein